MLEPSATPMARSILSFAATNTAVMCSHALPAMGSTMRPRNWRPMPNRCDTCSMEPVRNLRGSEVQASGGSVAGQLFHGWLSRSLSSVAAVLA